VIRNLRRNLAIALALGLVLYLALAVYASFSDLVDAFARFRWYYLPPALALVMVNYLVRFIKWEYLLRAIGIRLPAGLSFTVFISGLTMTISPGKLGEVLKSVLLKDSCSIPVSRSSPVVIAERVTDVIAVVLLGSAGALSYRSGRGVLVVTVLLIAGFIGIVQWRGLSLRLLRLAERLPLVRGYVRHLEEFYERSHTLLSARHLLPTVVLSTGGWFLECVAAWLCLKGLGLDLPLLLVVFIFVIASLAGALTMIPGGLGVAEAGMVGLLMANGVGRGDAVAAALLIRMVTFWFAIALGLAAVSFYGLRYGKAGATGSGAANRGDESDEEEKKGDGGDENRS